MLPEMDRNLSQESVASSKKGRTLSRLESRQIDSPLGAGLVDTRTPLLE